MDTAKLRKAAAAVYLACDEPVAKDLSEILTWAANEINRLEKALAVTEAAYRREKERANDFHVAIIRTLDENEHLADGDNCTLKALEDAVGHE